MRTVIAYYILIAGCSQGSAQDAAMLHADQALIEALTRADRAAMEGLLDKDFTWTDFEGKTLTKSDILKKIPKIAIRGSDNASRASYTYGNLGEVQENFGRVHLLRVWAKHP